MVLPQGNFRFVFTARNYAASVAFYRDGLGLPIDHDWDFSPADRGTVFVAGGGSVEVFGRAEDSEYLSPRGVSMTIQVTDVDAFYQLARQRGLTIVDPPADYPWGQRILRVSDPDGIIISLYTPIPH